VPQKITARKSKGENVRQELTHFVATRQWGKPYGLQDQVWDRLRKKPKGLLVRVPG